VRISLIVEGDSDKIILDGQSNWFRSLGLEFDIFPTGGKKNMIKSAMKHYRIALLLNCCSIFFLPDQNSDQCALVTREKIGMDSKDRAATIVMKRELEAWILADGQCIRDSMGINYRPSGQTDAEMSPKERLLSLMRRKLGYCPTEIEVAMRVAPCFSITRAAMANTSAKRFKEFIEKISLMSSGG
jgi:hypothetical protein